MIPQIAPHLPTRISSESAWPLRTATGETFAERKKRQETSNAK